MKKEKNRRSSMTFGEKMIFVAGILFCLVLITTAMMGGLFARYTTTGTGSDNARVARWGQLTITETGDFGTNGSFPAMIIPGVNLDKDVTVSFTGSEMAAYVFVSLDLSDHWNVADDGYAFTAANGGITWKVDKDQWTYLPGSSYVYYKILQPNTTIDNIPVLAELADGCEITVVSTLSDTYVASMTGSKIDIQASVIQAGGFKNVDEAWAYLNKNP